MACLEWDQCHSSCKQGAERVAPTHQKADTAPRKRTRATVALVLPHRADSTATTNKQYPMLRMRRGLHEHPNQKSEAKIYAKKSQINLAGYPPVQGQALEQARCLGTAVC